MTKINLDDVEPWGVGAILPPGRHVVRIESAEDTTSSGNNPQVELGMSAVAGEHAGLGIRDWLTLTPAALGRVRQFLEAAGLEIPAGDFDFPTDRCPGQVLVILVRREPKNNGDGEVSKVVAYMPDDGQHASDVPADTAGLAAAAGSGSQDDDIPF